MAYTCRAYSRPPKDLLNPCQIGHIVDITNLKLIETGTMFVKLLGLVLLVGLAAGETLQEAAARIAARGEDRLQSCEETFTSMRIDHFSWVSAEDGVWQRSYRGRNQARPPGRDLHVPKTHATLPRLQANQDEYQLRSFICDQYYQPGGPIFFVPGGEANIEGSVKNMGTWPEERLVRRPQKRFLADPAPLFTSRLALGDCSPVQRQYDLH